MQVCVLYFFFSSRRRHTRYWRDWSSDVCSSDLFMFARSREYPEVRAILDKVTASGKYFVGAINNEPLELNQYRIEAFHLRRNFLVFFSSCYVRSRKPEEAIFRVALEVTQRAPEQCLFIDDRALNLESPRRLGMNTIHHQNADQLRSELGKFGVEV